MRLSGGRGFPIAILIVLSVALSALGPIGAAAQTVATPTTAPDTPANAAVDRVGFAVDLGDFETAAELTYPAGQTGPFPTILLIAGSGPADMDFTLLDPLTGGTPLGDLPRHRRVLVGAWLCGRPIQQALHYRTA